MLPRGFVIAAAVAVGAAAFGAATAVKADQHCQSVCQAAVDPAAGLELLCAVPHTAGPVVGVTGVDGPVQISMPEGMEPAAPQTEIGIGGQLAVLEGGAVELSGPGCQVGLAGPAMVNVLPANGCACVISEGQVAPPPGLDTTVLAGIGVAGGIAAIILIATSGDDDPAPVPVTP